MREVFAEAISLVNLPFTALLSLFMLYWLLVALGALGDSEADVDADADGHLDGDQDFAGGVLHFINLGEAPLMGALSIFSLCLWTGSMIANHYFTDHQFTWALVCLLPNIILSAVVTRYLTLPLRPVFRLMKGQEAEPQSLIGRVGKITTSNATEAFGQAEIETTGAPLLVMVRTESGVTLPRGTAVVVFEEDPERELYRVTALPDHSLSSRS